MLLERQRRHLPHKRADLQTPAQRQREQAEKGGQTVRLDQATGLHVKATPFQGLQQRLDFPAQAILSKNVVLIRITDND